MINLKRQRNNFKDHVATFTDYGNIKIVDFKKPGSGDYRIRFLFEEDYHRLHISGDLGELIATNYDNMTYEGFGDFVHNTGYFEGKIDCHSRPLYTYDPVKGKTDLQELFAECEIEEKIEEDYYYDSVDEVIDDILEDFDDRQGICSKGYDILSKFISDAWEYSGDIGKEKTGILELYMLAFELAQKQIEAEAEKCADKDCPYNSDEPCPAREGCAGYERNEGAEE